MSDPNSYIVSGTTLGSDRAQGSQKSTSDDESKVSVVILGDGGTGKSCITMRLIRSKWVDEYDPTIEDSYSTQRTVDGVVHRLDIIDTAGQEEYRDMLGSLFSVDSSIDAYLLVYDITSEISLENLEYFDELIEQNLDAVGKHEVRPRPVKIVAGNKCDLEQHRAIPTQVGLSWARRHGCGFMETSAKSMVNIEEAFQAIIKQVVANRQQMTQMRAHALNGHLESNNRSGPNPSNFARGLAEKSEYMVSEGKTAKEKAGCCIIS